jgi:hypothetical protein
VLFTTAISPLAECSQHRGGLWPNGEVSFLLSLAEQPHLERFDQLQVANSEIGDLLSAGACVEHRRQERIVTSALRGGSIDRLED